MNIVITGGSGCGKSTLCRELASNPAVLLFDHDQYVNSLYHEPATIARLEAAVGCSDKKSIAALLLDPQQDQEEVLDRLARALAPELIAAIKTREACARKEQKILLLDFPAFFEMKDRGIADMPHSDLSICLVMDDKLRTKRLCGRGVATETQAMLRGIQYSQDHKALRSDVVITVDAETDFTAFAHGITTFFLRVALISKQIDSIAALHGLAADMPIARLLAPYHFAATVRHYHNLEHIEAMLDGLYQATKAGFRAHDLVALFWGILGHDLVYRPGAVDNELESARFVASLFAEYGFSEPRRALVLEHILSTKSHLGGSLPVSRPLYKGDNQLLLDLDMAILAAPFERVQRYEKEIRAEYGFVSDRDYLAGRLQFLKSTASSQIFASAYGAELEQRAKDNIGRLVNLLENSGAGHAPNQVAAP